MTEPRLELKIVHEIALDQMTHLSEDVIGLPGHAMSRLCGEICMIVLVPQTHLYVVVVNHELCGTQIVIVRCHGMTIKRLGGGNAKALAHVIALLNLGKMRHVHVMIVIRTNLKLRTHIVHVQGMIIKIVERFPSIRVVPMHVQKDLQYQRVLLALVWTGLLFQWLNRLYSHLRLHWLISLLILITYLLH